LEHVYWLKGTQKITMSIYRSGVSKQKKKTVKKRKEHNCFEVKRYIKDVFTV